MIRMMQMETPRVFKNAACDSTTVSRLLTNRSLSSQMFSSGNRQLLLLGLAISLLSLGELTFLSLRRLAALSSNFLPQHLCTLLQVPTPRTWLPLLSSLTASATNLLIHAAFPPTNWDSQALSLDLAPLAFASPFS